MKEKNRRIKHIACFFITLSQLQSNPLQLWIGEYFRCTISYMVSKHPTLSKHTFHVARRICNQIYIFTGITESSCPVPRHSSAPTPPYSTLIQSKQYYVKMFICWNMKIREINIANPQNFVKVYHTERATCAPGSVPALQAERLHQRRVHHHDLNPGPGHHHSALSLQECSQCYIAIRLKLS